MVEKKRFKMFKAKKKWLIAPLFFIGIGLGTAYQTNLVKADAQAPNSSEFIEALSSGASSGQNGTNSLKSASASVATASSSASDGQAKASTAILATTTNSKIGGSQSECQRGQWFKVVLALKVVARSKALVQPVLAVTAKERPAL